MKEKYVNIAIKSLIYEVSISPKFGLVSRTSLGSHKDMNFYSFIESAFSLYSYFSDIFDIASNNIEEEELFYKIRRRGLIAEKEMLFATKNINTHKGSIFSMGILFAALVNCNFIDKRMPSYEELCKKIQKMCKKILDELKNKNNNETKGQKAYRLYNIKGAREQAYLGYEMVLSDGIIKLKQYLSKKNLEISLILLLLYYISKLDDTNIINRSDIKTLEEIKVICKEKYYKFQSLKFDDDEFLTEMEALNDLFIIKNISPGGSADLLILTIFLHLIYEDNKYVCI